MAFTVAGALFSERWDHGSGCSHQMPCWRHGDNRAVLAHQLFHDNGLL